MKRVQRIVSAALAVILSMSMAATALPITAYADETGDDTSTDATMPTGDIAAFEASGDGTESKPWKISDVDSLYAFAAKVNNDTNGFDYSDCYVELTADITMPAGAIWSGVNTFNGTFDGNDHVISDMVIQSGTESTDIGFIKDVTKTASFSNLHFNNASLKLQTNPYAGILVGSAKKISVDDCSINGSISFLSDGGSTDIGGYIGYTSESCDISNSNFDGTINAAVGQVEQTAGGLVGYARAKCYIDDSMVAGNISTYAQYVGGFVGWIQNDTRNPGPGGMQITDCQNMANVLGSDQVGGIVGRYSDSPIDYGDHVRTIERCANRGDVKGSGYCGGIVGQIYGVAQVLKSTNKGTIQGSSYSGGICGQAYSKAWDNIEINDCYNAGNFGIGTTGGIVGYTVSGSMSLVNVRNCYVAPSEQMSSYGVAARLRFGGWAFGGATLQNVYYPEGRTAYGQKSGEETWFTVENVTSITSTDILSESTFSRFDFDTVWKMTANGPALAWETDIEDTGDTGDKGDESGTQILNGMSWPLLNDASSFYGGAENAAPWENYFANIDFKSVWTQLRYFWSDKINGERGYCYGLSFLAVAEDNGQVSIQGITQKKGDTLSDYGYSEIETNDKGEAYCVANEELTNAVERMQYAQWSSKIDRIKTNIKIDEINDNIGAIIEDAARSHAIVTDMEFAENGAHTVVIPRGAKGDTINGCYRVYIYDPNVPQINTEKLFGQNIKHLEVYDRPNSYIEFDYSNGKVRYGWYSKNTKKYFDQDVKKLEITDISKLDLEFFNDAFTLSDEGHTKIFILSSDIGISDASRRLILQKQKGDITYSLVDWFFHSGDTEAEPENELEWINVPNGTLCFDLEGESRIATISNNDQKAATIVSDGNLAATVGEDGKVSLEATDSTATFEVTTTVDDDTYASIKGELNEGESVQIEMVDGVVKGETNAADSVAGAVYEGDEVYQYDIDFGHTKGQQNPPEDISGGKGKIVGTTTAMEYRSVDEEDAEWLTCDDGATLAEPGNYEVRYAATDDKEASEAVQVTVLADQDVDPDDDKKDESGKDNDGSSNKKDESGTTDSSDKTGDAADNSGSSVGTVKRTQQAPHHHHYEWRVVREATEDQDGEVNYVCTRCGDVAYGAPLSSFYVYNQNVANSILKCSKNGTVKVDATKRGWISFSSMFVQALQERPDVTVMLRYKYGAATYDLTIPAGSYETVQALFDMDGTKDKNGNGLFCGYLNLATKFLAVAAK